MLTACGPGKVRDHGTRIYAPVSMVTCAWFCSSVYYRKVMTHITQWGFLHHFCIRVLENQRHLNYLVNLHSISKIKMVILLTSQWVIEIFSEKLFWGMD